MTKIVKYIFVLQLLAGAAAAQGSSAGPQDLWQAKLTLELADADIETAMRILAETTKTNIVLAPGTAGRIKNLKLANVPAEQIFDLLLRMYNLYAEHEGSVIIVYPLQDYIEQTRKRSGR